MKNQKNILLMLTSLVVGVAMTTGCSKSRPDPAELYWEHFNKMSGYIGPRTQWNSSSMRPTEVCRLGWIKVAKDEVQFRERKLEAGTKSIGAPDVFYDFEQRTVCPPRKNRFISLSAKYDVGKITMAYDEDDQVLWFFDEITVP